MFVNRKTEKALEQRGGSINLIAQGTAINGDIDTAGDLRIDGQIMGNIACTAKLVIGEQGDIQGNINCHSAEIAGTVRGQIVANEVLQLNRSASILGDIEATRLIVEDGASINGRCATSRNLALPGPSPEVKLIAYETPQAIVE